MKYLEWKHIILNMGKTSSQLLQVANFEKDNPYTADRYKYRLDSENKRIKEIMSIPERKERIETIAKNLSLFDWTTKESVWLIFITQYMIIGGI